MERNSILDKEEVVKKLGTILEKMKVLEELQKCSILEDFLDLTERYKNLCQKDEKQPSVVTSVEKMELECRASERRSVLEQMQKCITIGEFNIFSDKYEWSCMWERYLVKCVSQEEYYECEAHERSVRDYNQFMYEARQRGKKEGIEEAKLTAAKNLTELGLPTDIIAKGTGLSAGIIDAMR